MLSYVEGYEVLRISSLLFKKAEGRSGESRLFGGRR